MESSPPIPCEDTQFESSENNDLRNLSDEEYWRFWKTWFQLAQQSNDRDAHVFSHGVLYVEPGYEHLLPEVLSGVL